MKERLTKQQKDNLFETIILNNAPNKFVYNQLRQTLMDNPSMIVPFVGAGLSQFSYKAWGALLQDLLDQLADQSIDAPTRAKIQNEIKQGNFFQAADELETLIESDVFFFSLVSACNESKLINEGIPDDAAVRWLPKVFADSRIITTNYDCVLEMAYAQEKKYLRVCTPSDSRMFMQFMPRRLFKIHGSYDSNYEDIVLTSRSYEEKYAKGSLLYNNFKHIVQSSILFFLGASLRSDKTLDILKEIATELSVGGHYCGNMHYAIVHIDNDDDKIRRRKELAEYKILPILYSDNDHDGFENKHYIVGVILEKLYEEVTNQFIKRTTPITDVKNDDNLNSSDTKSTRSSFSPTNNGRVDGYLITQLMKQDPLKAFAYALSQNNLTMAETMLSSVEHAVPHEIYITKILAALASRGSSTAASRLFELFDDFMNGQYSTSQIVDIAGALVSYCNKQDKEEEYLEVLKVLLESIIEHATPKERASIYNQLSRLYYGIYMSNNEEQEYRDIAKRYIKQAIEYDAEEPSYYYNLTLIEKEDNPIEASKAIEKCIALKTDDLDHLSLAYKLYRMTNNSKADEVFQIIQEMDSTTAQLLSLGLDD